MENKQLKKLKETIKFWENSISEKVFKNAEYLLNHLIYIPEIYPLENAIQLEYDVDDKYLEIEIYEEYYCIYIEPQKKSFKLSIKQTYEIINLIKIFHKPINSLVLFRGIFNPPTIVHEQEIAKSLNNTRCDYIVYLLANDNNLKNKYSENWYYDEETRLEMLIDMTWNNYYSLIFGIENDNLYMNCRKIKEFLHITNLYIVCIDDKLDDLMKVVYSDLLTKENNFYIIKRTNINIEHLNEKCNKLFKNNYIIDMVDLKNKEINSKKIRELLNNNKEVKNMLPKNLKNTINNYKKTFK